MTPRASRGELAIWGYAFGYFACYVPYSALTKALSSGLLSRHDAGQSRVRALAGHQPGLAARNVRLHHGHGLVEATLGAARSSGRSLPFPGVWTFLSGICTAGIIATTTLAYTFSGVSIVFMMLLMRGGVLVIAPLVDFASRRKVRGFSWLALALSLSALFVAFFGVGRAARA